MTLSIGVVGTGMMGQFHVERLASSVPNARVVAVSDVNVEGAKQVAERVGARAYADCHELIGDDQVEAVLIASPGFTHEEFTLACLAADKPVLCEKPLAPTVDACLRVLEAEAAKPRRLVQVGQQCRYHGPIPADYRERCGDAYQAELQEWVDGVLQGQVTGPSAWDGY